MGDGFLLTGDRKLTCAMWIFAFIFFFVRRNHFVLKASSKNQVYFSKRISGGSFYVVNVSLK